MAESGATGEKATSSPFQAQGPATRKPPSVKNPQPIIEVIVKKGKKFFLHKDFLCYYSPYFAAIFERGNFRETAEKSVTLDHANAQVFGLFASWLYTQKIEIEAHDKGSDADKPSWSHLIELWILADYLQIATLQNLTIEVLHGKIDRLQKKPTKHFQYLYNTTLPGSSLRKLFVDACVWRSFSNGSIYQEEDFPEEMLRDIAVAYHTRCKTQNCPNPYKDFKNYFVKTTEDE